MSEALTPKMQMTFGSVHAFSDNFCVISARIKQLSEKDGNHEVLWFWKDGVWSARVIPDILSSFIIFDCDKPTLFALRGDGFIYAMDRDGAFEEWVDASGGGPDPLRWLLHLQPVGQHLYTCGMGRMFYRRVAKDSWARMDQAIRTDDVVGLKALDGYSEREIYSVGFLGEIWLYDGNSWHSVASPTNIKLESVLCSKDGCVYAVGGRGTILRGSGLKWGVIENDLSDETLWKVCEFKGSVYFSGRDGVYRLSRDLELLNVSPPNSTTCFISASDSRLWSVGPNDICTYDGKRWQKVHPPP
jgi:hypothetical protein